MDAKKPDTPFEALTRKLVQVPKKELDRQVKKYRAKRKRRRKS